MSDGRPPLFACSRSFMTRMPSSSRSSNCSSGIESERLITSSSLPSSALIGSGTKRFASARISAATSFERRASNSAGGSSLRSCVSMAASSYGMSMASPPSILMALSMSSARRLASCSGEKRDLNCSSMAGSSTGMCKSRFCSVRMRVSRRARSAAAMAASNIRSQSEEKEGELNQSVSRPAPLPMPPAPPALPAPLTAAPTA